MRTERSTRAKSLRALQASIKDLGLILSSIESYWAVVSKCVTQFMFLVFVLGERVGEDEK